MKKLIFPGLLLASLMSFAGCEKDLKMDLSFTEKPQLNIYGFVYADRPTLLMISKTQPYNTPDAFGTNVREATVRYYINGSLRETVRLAEDTRQDNPGQPYDRSDWDKSFVLKNPYISSSIFLWYKSTALPRPGDRVRIEVESAGLPVASFDDVLPPVPVIKHLKTEEIALSDAGNLLGLDSREKEYERFRAGREFDEGLTPETTPFLPFSAVSDTRKALSVSFDIEGINSEQYYILGVVPAMKLPYIPSMGIPLSAEKLAKNIVCTLLYDLSGLINADASPIFPVRAKEMARARIRDNKYPGMFQPYFFTGADAKSYRVSFVTPLLKADPSEYGVDHACEVVLSAVSGAYGQFAESGYGLYEGNGSLGEEDFGELMAELAMERCNLTNALGVIYTATPLQIPIR